MTLETWIAIGVIVAVVGLAALYVIREKKKGKKCIGCPGGCCAQCQGCGHQKTEAQEESKVFDQE